MTALPVYATPVTRPAAHHSAGLHSPRAGGSKGPLAWEFAAVKRWDDAPAPGQVARRVIEGFTQRELPDRWAWVGSTVAHWAYGSLTAAAYGVVVGSLRQPRVLYGLPLGAAVWVGGYLVLPGGALRADLEVRREDPCLGSGRPSRLRRRYRSRILASRHAPIWPTQPASMTIAGRRISKPRGPGAQKV